MKKIPILKKDLFQHQVNNLQFHLTKTRSADWSDCGTGKSLIALAKFAMLYRQGLVKSLLIVCPLSVVESWADQIEEHTYFNYTKLVGSLERKIKLLGSNSSIFIISYDSLPGRRDSTLGVLLDKVIQHKFGMIILDEVTFAQNMTTLRTKALQILCDRAGYVIGLSGTPSDRDLTKLLTIYRIIDRGETFGENIYRARNIYFKNIGWKFPKWAIKPEIEKEFQERMFINAVRVRKEECLDLPEKVWNKRISYLSKDQVELYRPIADGLVHKMEFDEGNVRVDNILTQLMKLSQIAGGFLYTDKDPVLFHPNPKLLLLRDLIFEIPLREKIIIYRWWVKETELIADMLSSVGQNYVILAGAMSPKDRERIVDKFMEDQEIRIMIASPTTGGFGLTLTAASYIIYYNMSWGLTAFNQSQDRIHRIGQKQTCFYYVLQLKDSIDEYILENLKEGTQISSELTNHKTWSRLKRNLKLIKGNE